MKHKSLILYLILLLQLTGCSGGDTIAEASFGSSPSGAADFRGQAYMLTQADITAADKLKQQIELVYAIRSALNDEEFEPVINILSENLFAQRSTDNFKSEVQALRSILQQAMPDWEAAEKAKIDKLKIKLATSKATYEKNAELLNAYNEYIKTEFDDVTAIEKHLADNLAQMKSIKIETMDYINKVIVEEELPLKQVKLSGAAGSVAQYMKYIFGGFAPEGSKGFNQALLLEQKNLTSKTLIRTVNGKRYVASLDILYKEVAQNKKHFDFILQNYVKHGELWWESTPGVYSKPQGEILIKLREAKKVLSKKALSASNKYGIDDISKFKSNVARDKKVVENIENKLAAPEDPKDKSRFLSKLTSKARSDLTKSLKVLIPQVVDDFYTSI
jgi:hypothetical protein